METEVYDTVRVETLEKGDRIRIAGYDGIVTGVEDMTSHIILSWYNEDTDEDEEDSLYAGSMVDLIHDTYKED